MAKTKTVDLGKSGSFTERPGALHRALGVPEGQKLGPAKIAAAAHSSNPKIRRMADSAKGFEQMRHPVGAKQVFGRSALPQRPVAPEAAGPDKDAEMKKQKQQKMGAADIFSRRR